ncbi:MAG: EF-P beta-lysylation protein EpmB [bacterium]
MGPILPFSDPVMESHSWRTEYAQSFTDVDALLAYLDLESDRVSWEQSKFPFRVTQHFASLMKKGDPADPLLRQVLPISQEQDIAPGFVTDPTGDQLAETGIGLLKKYCGRALLITTSACGIHCRYCFRRHFPYQEHDAGRDRWDAAIQALSEMQDIDEVILSGGDPLALDNQRLKTLIDRLAAIPHIQRLRIHTRMPVILPSRLDTELEQIVAGTRLNTVIVLHANHGNEISPSLSEALIPLRSIGISVFNQSVLLAGVNDDAEVLSCLSQQLFGAGIIPYYLHLLDPVAGSAHFNVSIEQAKKLHKEVRSKLPGYLVPKLVKEEIGQNAKTPV